VHFVVFCIINRQLLHSRTTIIFLVIESIIRITTYIYTGCFTNCGHYCRKWFPRSLWSKTFIL